jgi:hypothetical protein
MQQEVLEVKESRRDAFLIEDMRLTRQQIIGVTALLGR